MLGRHHIHKYLSITAHNTHQRALESASMAGMQYMPRYRALPRRCRHHLHTRLHRAPVQLQRADRLNRYGLTLDSLLAALAVRYCVVGADLIWHPQREAATAGLHLLAATRRSASAMSRTASAASRTSTVVWSAASTSSPSPSCTHQTSTEIITTADPSLAHPPRLLLPVSLTTTTHHTASPTSPPSYCRWSASASRTDIRGKGSTRSAPTRSAWNTSCRTQR